MSCAQLARAIRDKQVSTVKAMEATIARAQSVQAGFTRAGLPVGMQLLGRPFDEATLFALGHAYQGAADFHRKAPPL